MDVVKAATFEAVVQSSITACDGQPLCLEEVEVDGGLFVGLGTKCEQRFRWTNENYLELTNEEHYDAEPTGNESRRLSVPEETQRWIITSKSGCLRHLANSNPPMEQEYADGHRLAVDPECKPGYDTQFFAIASPFFINQSLHDLDQPFSLVESHPNRTRRLAYYANTTLPYKEVEGEDDKNCTCVDFENDPLGALMITQAHVHETRPDETESYFYGRDHCDGPVLSVHIFPPSPPPPVPEGNNPPPQPPYIEWEVRMVTSAFASTGVFFLCTCVCCVWIGLNGRVRGNGRSKWWGTQEMRIDRPPLGGPGNRAYYPTSGAVASPGGFFATLPSAETVFDPVRQKLLG